MKHGIFDAFDCPYSATAIEAVKAMQNFEGKSFGGKAELVNQVLETKHS